MKHQKHKSGTISPDKLVVGALTLTTLVTGGIMSSMHVNADDGNNAVVDDTTIIVPTTCSMSGTINEGEEHTATILPGAYKNNIGKTDIKALCNDFNGFSIYAIGYSNNTEGTNTMIGQTTGSTIATGTNDSGDTSNWAMKLTKISDSTITYNPSNLSITNSYDNYNIIPSTLTKVVEYKDTNTSNSSATDQTKGAHIETTYATYIASTQPADTYNGKVKYLLVHPANFTTGTYSIAYNANGGTGTMNTETGINNYEPHTLAASTLTAPAGYMLAGWCDTQDSTASGVVQGADPQTTCTGTSYADQAVIPASTVASGSSLTLYAYWKQLPRTMQNVSTWKNSLSTGETITVTDERDDKEYTVAKLADGKVWMTRNLDLQKEDLKAGVTLNSDNTDHPASGFVLPDSQKSGSDSWYDSSNAQTSIDTAHVYDLNDNGKTYHYCVEYQYGSCKTYSDEVIPSEDLGNYYNWYSATAGTGTYSTGSGQVATGSICPAGWRLPNNATSNSTATDWSTLLKEYGVIASATGYPSVDSEKLPSIFESPISLVRAGNYYNGVLSVDAGGFLLSSMAGGSDYARVFYFGDTSVNPWYSGNKYSGYSVRCVAE